MMPVHVTARYVDGTVARFDAGVWDSQRGDGIDSIEIGNASGSSIFQGHSAYWLYRENDTWVGGQASFGYNRVIPPEVLFLPDGGQTTRSIDYVPDLQHRQLKLGWWRKGEERPPWP